MINIHPTLVSKVTYYIFFAAMVGFLLSLLIASLTPRKAVFTYTAVEPVSSEIKIGDNLVMYSTAEFNRKTSVVWNDILRCEGVRYSTFSSNSDKIVPREPTSARWIYDATLPDHPIECYMEAVITAQIHPFVKKQQTITSEPFNFVE